MKLNPIARYFLVYWGAFAAVCILLVASTAAARADIVFPVDPADRWTLVDTRESPPLIVAQHMEWPGPQLDAYPPGFDHLNYALLKEVLPDPPDVDVRYYQVFRLAPVLDVPNNTIGWAWSQQERSLEEKKAAAETEEGARHGLIALLPREARDTHIAVALLLAIRDGFAPGPQIEQFLTDYKQKGQRLRENWQRLNEYFDQIEAGAYPDLDSWPHPEPME